MNDINDGLDLISVLLQHYCFVLREVLLTLKAGYTLLLIFPNSIHLLPDFVLLAGILGLLSLLVQLREILIYTPVERLIGYVLLGLELKEHDWTEVFDELVRKLLVKLRNMIW
jgi:hypothetical protein